MKVLCFLIPFALVAAAAMTPQVAGAQVLDPRMSGIAVGPTLFEIDVGPGATWQGEFTIVASGQGRHLVVDLEIKDLAQTVNGAKSSTDPGTGVRSAANWISVGSEMTLGGGDVVRVPVSVTCPDDAFGSYSAIILVELRPEDAESSMAAMVVPAINVEFLVRVAGSRGALELDVESMEFGGTNQEPKLSLAIRNTGVWKTDVTGDVLLYPESGGFPERTQVPLRPGGQPHTIYPGRLLRLDCAFDRRPPAGKYVALVRLDLGQGRESRAQYAVTLGSGASEGDRDQRAELGTDLWLEETIFELSLPPGAARTVPIRVRNIGDDSIELKAAVEDARMESDGAWTFARTTTPVPGLTIAVSPDSIVVGPRRTVLFRASVKADRDMVLDAPVVKAVHLFGGLAGSSGEDEWEIVYDTGALLVLSPPAQGEAVVDVVGLKLIRSDPDRNPGSALLSLSNSGGVTGHVKGTIVLRRTSGQSIATMTIGEDHWVPIMPGGRREFRMRLPIVDEGDFVVEAEIIQKGTDAGPRRAEAFFTSTEVIPEGLREGGAQRG